MSLGETSDIEHYMQATARQKKRADAAEAALEALKADTLAWLRDRDAEDDFAPNRLAYQHEMDEVAEGLERFWAAR